MPDPPCFRSTCRLVLALTLVCLCFPSPAGTALPPTQPSPIPSGMASPSLPSGPSSAASGLPHFVVVGGGIAGVTCCQEIAASGKARVTLIAPGGLLKGAKNVVKLTRRLETFDVEETPIDEVRGELTDVVEEAAASIDAQGNKLILASGRAIPYDKICLCMGASPKRSSPNPLVLTLRDTQSALELSERLKGARRIAIVGNGGIALELVHEIRTCEIIWAVRDSHIGNSFFDNDAAEFLAPSLSSRLVVGGEKGPGRTLLSHEWDGRGAAAGRSKLVGHAAVMGSALGPEWLTGAMNSDEPKNAGGEGSRVAGFLGKGGDRGEGQVKILLETNCEVSRIEESAGGEEWPILIHLTNGQSYGCDFVVQATGVDPNSQLALTCPLIKVRADDGGVQVDGQMKTSCGGVYAAGDVSSVQLEEGGGWGGGVGEDRKWHQMRLWSQAKSQGAWAARCMLEDEDVHLHADPFELFAHATSFLGHKVVLLGRYNAQGMRLDDDNVKVYIRCSPGKEYVKIVLRNGRMQGAVLIGETDLEETFENLILNGLDLSSFGESILDPDIDLEDFFD